MPAGPLEILIVLFCFSVPIVAALYVAQRRLNRKDGKPPADSP